MHTNQHILFSDFSYSIRTSVHTLCNRQMETLCFVLVGDEGHGSANGDEQTAVSMPMPNPVPIPNLVSTVVTEPRYESVEVEHESVFLKQAEQDQRDGFASHFSAAAVTSSSSSSSEVVVQTLSCSGNGEKKRKKYDRKARYARKRAKDFEESDPGILPSD